MRESRSKDASEAPVREEARPGEDVPVPHCSEGPRRSSSRLGSSTWLVSGAVLASGVFVLASVPAWWWGGVEALKAAVLAWMLCLAAAAFKPLVDRIPERSLPWAARMNLLAGIRMGVPLAGLMVLMLLRPALLESGIVVFLLLFYYAGLIGDVVGWTRRLKQSAPASK